MGHKPFTPFENDKPRHRPERLAARIKDELGAIIPGELKDPRLEDIAFLTIESVTVAPDMRNATVEFSLADSEKKHAPSVEAALNHAAGFVRAELVPLLQVKITPHLTFKYDRGTENTRTIDQLLEQIHHGSESDRGKK